MKYKKCRICKLKCNVSVKDKQEIYVCPICESKVGKHSNVSSVLLRNKIKFNMKG